MPAGSERQSVKESKVRDKDTREEGGRDREKTGQSDKDPERDTWEDGVG